MSADATPHLGLPYIAAAQAQKHVTHNEALHILDSLVQLAVLDKDRTAPPGSPAEGDRYIVAASPTGAWAGQAGKIAAFIDGAWSFMAPLGGWIAFAVDEATLYFWNGSAWASMQSIITALQNLALLGIGTTADATNPFSAKLNNALWTAKYASEGGDGDLRYTMNRETAIDTVSTLFQTNYSGRAEFGLIGDNNLTLKVSPDGSAWTTALQMDPATGYASNLVVLDNTFQIRDSADPTKVAVFEASGINTATARTYTLPNATGTLALLANLSQTFTGATTFSGATVTVGSSTAAATYGLGTGATTNGTTKTINIGIAGVSGSITNINLGSAVAGATGTLTINSPTTAFNGAVTLNPANASISLAPTGTGTVTINPAAAGALDNVAIGGTTPLAGAFTTLGASAQLNTPIVSSNAASALDLKTSGGVQFEIWHVASAVNFLQASGSASTTPALAAAGAGANIDIVLTPKGTGQVRLPTTANGSVATAMSSLGPTGSHTTVQEWFTIKNAAGTVRYVPAF